MRVAIIMLQFSESQKHSSVDKRAFERVQKAQSLLHASFGRYLMSARQLGSESVLEYSTKSLKCTSVGK